jgi:ABC-2 type transport system permease protein
MNSSIDIDSMINALPKGMLEAFNFDVVSISLVFGWFASEGYMFITLLGGCYFAILGGTILLKEQNDHTIDFLYSKPVSKSKILTSKLLCGFVYLILFNVVVGLTTFIVLKSNNDFDFTNWALITIAPFILDVFFFLISLLISLFFKKTSKGISIGIGTVFIMYLLNLLGTLSDKIEILKYFSIFNYMDSRQIVTDHHIGTFGLILTLTVCIIMISATYIIYNKKELGK